MQMRSRYGLEGSGGKEQERVKVPIAIRIILLGLYWCGFSVF